MDSIVALAATLLVSCATQFDGAPSAEDDVFGDSAPNRRWAYRFLVQP